MDGIELPQLSGSDKQIAWAESIREKAVVKVMAENPQILENVNKISSAKWWIDNRDRFMDGLKSLPEEETKKEQWKSIRIDEAFIKTQTAKSILIKLPHKSDYDGYCFWHPAKLVRDASTKFACFISISYTDTFTFRLKKYGKGKYNNREIIDEIEIGAEEFEEAYQHITVADTIRKNPYETRKPEKLEPVNVEVDKELLDE